MIARMFERIDNLFARMFIDKEEAKEMGMTHEGTLFGVPAWFGSGDIDANPNRIVPKFIPFVYYTRFADASFDFVQRYFITGGGYLVTPMSIKGPIK